MKIYFDEAGRWPLFGPVYVWLVISFIPQQALKKHLLFQDSKLLSPKKRLQGYQEILELQEKKQILAAVGSADNGWIDRYGLTRAIQIAIYKALYQLLCHLTGQKQGKNFTIKQLKNLIGDYENLANNEIELILDGKSDFGISKELGIKTQTIVHGDRDCVVISMASILAKVSRDHLLDQYAKKYPGYGLEKHKGYWTKFHYQAIQELWILPEHRKLFLKDFFPDRKIEKFAPNQKILG